MTRWPSAEEEKTGWSWDARRSAFGSTVTSCSVGRQEGRFYAIRLYARGGAVEMLNLRVIYANGDPDNIPVRHILDRGERTRPIDPRGRARSIRMIEMVYRALPNRRDREPIVCVEGLARDY